MGVAFEKYEGLGNDFVVVEGEREEDVSPELARSMCDRRFGIGADGVLLILPPSSGEAHARMRVINADGSVPEMCGNGLRCAVLHLARQRSLADVRFETDAGLKACRVEDAHGEGIVTVDMGIVRFTGDAHVELDGDRWDLALGDAGNPHAITVRPAERATIDAVGPRLATHPMFAAGTNVEFAVYRGREIDLVVWERGVGVTHACGTGACATVAVGVAKGWAPRGVEVAVHLPGGTLFVTITERDHAIMRGPARHVFTGAYEVRRA
jgi:diaminopimelate epimerase